MTCQIAPHPIHSDIPISERQWTLEAERSQQYPERIIACHCCWEKINTAMTTAGVYVPWFYSMRRCDYCGLLPGCRDGGNGPCPCDDDECRMPEDSPARLAQHERMTTP